MPRLSRWMLCVTLSLLLYCTALYKQYSTVRVSTAFVVRTAAAPRRLAGWLAGVPPTLHIVRRCGVVGAGLRGGFIGVPRACPGKDTGSAIRRRERDGCTGGVCARSPPCRAGRGACEDGLAGSEPWTRNCAAGRTCKCSQSCNSRGAETGRHAPRQGGRDASRLAARRPAGPHAQQVASRHAPALS